MILVDTSVWIDHFRRGRPHLAKLLESGLVATHPFVIGELACGNLRRRAEILMHLRQLHSTPAASDAEVHALVTERRLYGRGIGWIDAHLLASCLLHRDTLWTLDKALSRAASALDLLAYV